MVCTDPEGFRVDDRFTGVKLVHQPLSRVQRRELGKIFGIASNVLDLVGVGMALILCILPVSSNIRRAALKVLAKISGRRWLLELTRADMVVAVGGGYLGDSYLRQSIVRLMIYRIAQGISVPVETMPISVSSCSDPRLRRSFKYFGSRVVWRAREESTAKILVDLGMSVELVPDLAWINAVVELTTPRNAIVVCPLGSAFYGTGNIEKRNQIVADIEYLSSIYPDAPIRFVAMHHWDARLGDGQDDRQCQLLMELVRPLLPGRDIRIEKLKTYAEVVHLMASANVSICERLHAALASVVVGTPAVVHGYEPKHAGVLGLAGLDDMLGPASERTWHASNHVRIGDAARLQAQHLYSQLFVSSK